MPITLLKSTTPRRYRLRSAAVLAISLLAASLLAGCLSRKPLVKQSFGFASPTNASAYSSASGRILGIRSVEIAPPYQGRLFVYRTGDGSYERDPYAEFMVSPADSLASSIRDHLRASGRFRAIAGPASAQRPNTIAEFHVPLLYADFRKPAEAASILKLHCVFFDAPGDIPTSVIFQKDYSRRILLKTRTAAAVMAAWNQALQEIVSELVSDLKDKDL